VGSAVSVGAIRANRSLSASAAGLGLVRGIGGERMGRTLDGCVESGLVVDAGLVASVHAALFPDALERRHLSLELLVVVLLPVKVAAAASRRLFVVVIFRTHEVLVDELLLLGVLLGGRGFTLGHGVSLRGGPFACGWVARGRVRRRSGALARAANFVDSENADTSIPTKNGESTVQESRKKPRLKPRRPTLRPRIATMSTQSGMWVPDTNRPIFDPHLDIATVVFSHVQCVKTRLNLAQVSTLWRDASKTAAAYPLEFDVDAFPESWHDHVGENVLCTPRTHPIIGLLDNDEALSLPYERVVGLLGEAAKNVCDDAADRGSVRLLKWARENNLDWSVSTCSSAAAYGHLPALKYLHENGCPWDWGTCYCAACYRHWDCLQYAVDNKCPEWEKYAEEYAKRLR